MSFFDSLFTPAARIAPKPKNKAKIGENLEVDVVLSRETKFESDVTENPVEDGFPVADHVTRKPMTLTMDVIFTPTPVTWASSFGSANTMNGVVNKIMAIYKKAEPITVTLNDAIYKDMVMTSAPLPRTIENGYCYKMQLQFTHVRIVKQRTEDIPADYTANDAAGKSGTTESDAGAASQSDIGTGLTTVDDTQTVGVTTMGIDFSNSGSVNTGYEMTAGTAAMAAYSSLASAVLR